MKRVLNGMIGLGLVIISLYLLLIVGGPLFGTVGPSVIATSPTGDMAVDPGTMVARVNFVVFKVIPLILLGAGILMTIISLFYEEYQTYEYQ
tara:strand:+ start:333 stop:608 length:276 start_codon:yes stop_codon:yes gene_type:complete